MNRRRFLGRSLVATGGFAAGALARRPVWAQGTAPGVVTPDRMRPAVPYGVQTGDVTGDRAIVWSRTDRPARLVVDWATNDAFRDAAHVVGPAALGDSDFTARVDLRGLPAGQDIFYRVVFEDLANVRVASEPVTGRFRTPAASRRTVTFAFSGDEVGQGWGINPAWGGMKMYEVMRRARPDFFIHSGDQIYADNPLKPEVSLEDGTVWKNVTTPAKAKVAETLDEFRGNFAYNLNVVWVTADVHYASATHYDPVRARYGDFTPFWEFVAGPINAGTFGPGEIDRTFGPDVKYVSVPAGMKQNRPPTEGKQYFGLATIDGATEVLTVTLNDLSGAVLYRVDLQPA